MSAYQPSSAFITEHGVWNCPKLIPELPQPEGVSEWVVKDPQCTSWNSGCFVCVAGDGCGVWGVGVGGGGWEVERQIQSRVVWSMLFDIWRQIHHNNSNYCTFVRAFVHRVV